MPNFESGRLRALLPLWLGALAVALATYGAVTDSLTVDEPSHLIAGWSALTLGDYRLSPDHPPLARMLLAAPIALRPYFGATVVWRPQDPPAGTAEAWRSGDFFSLGRDFFEVWNDGPTLARGSRLVAVALLAVLLLLIYRLARQFFGPAAAAVALAVAALDPTLLAHGHLATIDLPFTLASLLALVATNAWLARPSPARLGGAALAFAAATLVKFSFFVLVPALLAMVIAARRGAGGRATARAVATLAASCAAAALVAIWAAYGFRFSAVRGDQATTATMHVLSDAGRPRPTTPAGAWEAVLHDPATGADRRGPLPPLLRFARDHRLLPEAYLYGIAYVAKKGLNRAGYLRGQYTRSGFASYFAWAFAIKTPLPSLLLAAFGLVALVGRWRKQPQLPPFAWGSLVFALGYLAALHASALNLGLRHLLPIAPLWALAAAAAWPQGPPTPAARRWALLISALIGWLAFSTLMAAPHFLGYFNESVGGWRRGHLYLVDSNLDWGQDLLRLEKRLRGEQGPIYLAQADNPPFPPGLSALNPRRLFGSTNRAPFPERIAGGLYVISATELLGVYRPLARAETWRDPRWLDRFEQLTSAAALAARPTTDPPEGPDELEALRRMRLLARLSSREPDERLGTSLFLFRLTDQQVREATDP